MQQLTHYTSKFQTKTFPITVVCENVNNAPNIGSLFRICDAFGIEKLIFCGDNLPIPSRKMQKTSRATEKYVNYEIIDTIVSVINKYKSSHQLIALEITNSSKAIHQIQFNSSKPILLIIGDENFGISETILNQVDTCIHIDMFGKNSSMNVVQATNIALYEMTKQLNK